MGIGMHRRHYKNEADSARVVLEPTGVPEDEAGGVVAIGDEPGTAPTPSHADSPGREFDEDTTPEQLEGQGEAPDANEKGASADEFGDPEHSVDPEGHPVDHEKVEENLEDEPASSAEVAPEAPSRGASTAVWQEFYTSIGKDPEGLTRDQLADGYLGPKPE